MKTEKEKEVETIQVNGYEHITGAEALLNCLVEEGVDCFPAVMTNFSEPKEVQQLRQRLKEIRPDFADFEEEELILYPFVKENLQKTGISYQTWI